MDFILGEVNILQVMEQFKNKTKYEMDRVFLSSLQASTDVNLPGGFTHTCLDNGTQIESITRFLYYKWGNCESGIIQNGVCLGGRKNLRFMEKMPQLFFSPMDPKEEFMAYFCWRERMFNRTYSPERAAPTETLEPFMEHYAKHAMIRFHQEKQNPSFRAEQFLCQ